MTATATATATVTLDQPIVRGDTTIDKVTIRKPGPGELRGLSLRDFATMETDAMMTLLPRITMPILTQPELEGMDLADFVDCCNQVAIFLQKREPVTGSPTA